MSEEMESKIEHFELDDENRMSEYPVFKNMEQVHACISDMADKFKEAFPKTKDDNGNPIEYCFLVTGTSGAFMAGCLCPLLTGYTKTVKICRKEGDDSHHKHTQDYDARINENAVVILLDDFSSTGRTLNRVYDYFNGIKQKKAFGLEPLTIDCVILSGSVYTERLDFKPKKIISHSVWGVY